MITLDDVLRWLRAYRDCLAQEKTALTRLDAAIGDADHGTNMDRGFGAALDALDAKPPDGIAAAFNAVAMALISKVGGASGPLYGTLFMRAGAEAKGKETVGLEDWAAMMAAGLEGVRQRGKAETGDKTMIDALAPAVAALQEAADEGRDLTVALADAAEAAREGMEATTPLVARKGRASYLGERSAGHQDPGATSTYYFFQTASDALA